MFSHDARARGIVASPVEVHEAAQYRGHGFGPRHRLIQGRVGDVVVLKQVDLPIDSLPN